ncbi:YcnI family copper-binding membrane protein [Diaminobutyricibacter sp. McL0608]|uniref:YcnI family copper-binding membrane protein n=1 Tax=Leifsonia sp. McL0608 TaxID=3143537 RepID=UPI0031F2F230
MKKRINARTFARAASAAAATAVLVVAAPLAASAHVHIDPNQAAAGSYTTLSFTVPTESATAGTVKLEVDLPTKTPFSSVSYQPMPGWKTTVVTEKLATPVKTDDGTVTEAPIRITWTADPGVQVGPGAFEDFVVQAGPVPDTGSVVLPVTQTYSDGTVVNWNQPTPASGEEPEHPAPTLYVNTAPPADPETVHTLVTSTPAPAASSSTSSSDTVAIALGIAGLALGAIALVVAVYAVTRRRPAWVGAGAGSSPGSGAVPKAGSGPGTGSDEGV